MNLSWQPKGVWNHPNFILFSEPCYLGALCDKTTYSNINRCTYAFNQTRLLRIIQQCLPVLNRHQSIIDIALSLVRHLPSISIIIILKVLEVILNLQFWNYIITSRMHQLVLGVLQLITLINSTASSHSQHWRVSLGMK